VNVTPLGVYDYARVNGLSVSHEVGISDELGTGPVCPITLRPAKADELPMTAKSVTPKSNRISFFNRMNSGSCDVKDGGVRTALKARKSILVVRIH
jgi:hypothetical protein